MAPNSRSGTRLRALWRPKSGYCACVFLFSVIRLLDEVRQWARNARLASVLQDR